jgi:hypothetical protein
MQSFYDVVVDTGDRPIAGAQVFVYDSTGALATIYSDVNGTPQANPIVTNADGGYLFYAANGVYSVVIIAAGYNSQTITGVTISGTQPVLPIANGGTGATTAPDARTNLDVPSRTGADASGTWNISILGNAATATSAGSVAAGDITGVVAVANGGTGLPALGTGVAAFLATPSSANLAAAVTGETGTGALVFASSPTLVTPTLGAATATSINGLIINRGLNANADSVAIGPNALDSTTSANNNVAIGRDAGTDLTSGTNNTLLGRLAGKDLTTGSQNVVVGRESGKDLETGDENIYIGKDSQASASSVSKEIVIGAVTGKGGDTFYVGGSSGAYNEDNNASWLTTSDQRIKKNIVDNNDGLAKIQAIKVRNFEYRLPAEITELPASAAVSKTGVQLGVIAQEMLPECIREQSNGVLSVNTDPLVWYLINAVKQLAARVEELEK